MYTGTGVVLDLLQVKYSGHEYGLRLNVIMGFVLSPEIRTPH